MAKFQFDNKFKKGYYFYIRLFIIASMCILKIVSGDDERVSDEEEFEEYYSKEDLMPICPLHTYNKTCCETNEFQCNNGRCIPKDKVCDSWFFKNTSSISIRLSWMRKSECADGSDEMGCSGETCDTRKIKCDHLCIDLPGNKSRCTCYKGYTYLVRFNNGSCVDVNECAIGVHTCSHDCVNLNGTYGCTCRKGFYKDSSNGHEGSCKALENNGSIIFSSDDGIYSYSLENKTETKVMDFKYIESLDYDPSMGMVYWLKKNQVWRSYIPGALNGQVTVGYAQPLVYYGSYYPSDIIIKRSIALDWTAGNIYWLSTYPDENHTEIKVSKSDGRYVKTLTEIPIANSLVLDPETGKMYWACGGDQAQIGGGWMNGAVKWIITRLTNQNPVALTLDHHSNGRLYWADSITNTIYFVYKDGTRVTQVYKNALHTPISMDVFEDFIYWMTNDTNVIVRLDKFGRGEVEVLVNTLDDHTSLKIYHHRKRDVEIRKRGMFCEAQCSHLCLHIPREFKCACPDGNRLITVHGNVVCDNEKEAPLTDTLACNCLDKTSICNKSSHYWYCPCDTECPEDTSYVWLYILLLVVLFIVIIVIFALSFFKRGNI